jgi:hypothetical protein
VTDKNEQPETAMPAQPQVVVVDPHHAPVQYVDWIVTGGPGPASGTINVVLAAVDYAMTGIDGRPQAIVQSRLRLSLGTAASLHRFLGDPLTAASPKPQSNTLN